MPRRATSGLVALVLAGLLVAPATAASAAPGAAPATTATPATAAEPGDPTPVPLADEAITPEIATEVLEIAVEAVNGEVVNEATGETEAPTMALRDLLRVLPRLTEPQQEVAGRLLARPTEGFDPELGVGYTTENVKVGCNTAVCVHYVVEPGNVDRATDAWAYETQKTVTRARSFLLGTQGYNAPPTDGTRGGNALFDVYLADLGELGLYGYCAPESEVPGTNPRATSYCVLDNDYVEFGYDDPREPLQVTAVHEFSHAVQFGYDFTEDLWLYESTATWVEERFAPNVNDAWSYLEDSALTAPTSPLDRAREDSFSVYGNWIFWEYLAARFGDNVVRQTWNRASNPWQTHSLQAVEAALRDFRDGSGRGNLAKELAGFGAANVYAAAHYRSARALGLSAPTQRYLRLTNRQTSTSLIRSGVAPMTTNSTTVVPDSSLGPNRLRLRVRFSFANTPSGGAFAIVETKDGKISRVPITTQSGGTTAYLPFSTATVRRVTITFSNASTRFDCDRGTDRACNGRPLDAQGIVNYDLRVERY